MEKNYKQIANDARKKGWKLSPESKKKISDARKRFYLNGGKSWNDGKHHSEETKRKIAERRRGTTASVETKLKMSKAHKGRIHNKEWVQKVANAIRGRKHSEESKQKMSNSAKILFQRTYTRILQEIPELEKQGFRCVPIGKVVPDIIAIKNNKLYAIEIEYSEPKYEKYDKNNYKNYFDDVIWIIKK